MLGLRGWYCSVEGMIGYELFYDSVFSGRLCSLCKMVRHLGFRFLVINWLHFCKIGLYAIMNAYS